MTMISTMKRAMLTVILLIPLLGIQSCSTIREHLPAIEVCLIVQDDTKICIKFDPTTGAFSFSGDILDLFKLSPEKIDELKTKIKKFKDEFTGDKKDEN